MKVFANLTEAVEYLGCLMVGNVKQAIAEIRAKGITKLSGVIYIVELS